MVIKFCLRVVCILFLLLGKNIAFADTTDQKICFLGFCVDDPLSKQKLVRTLGAGFEVHRPDDVGLSICYLDRFSELSVDFIFNDIENLSSKSLLQGVMLSKQSLCTGKKHFSRRRFSDTLAGVSIGMCEPEVVELLGIPNRIDDAKQREARDLRFSVTRYSSKFGERIFVYEKPDELAVTFVYFQDGRVRTIWYSESE